MNKTRTMGSAEMTAMAGGKDQLKLKAYRAYFLARKAVHKITGHQTSVYVWKRTDWYREMWRQAAEALGAEFLPHTTSIWRVKLAGKSVFMDNHAIGYDNPIALRVAGHKPLTYRLLMEADIPVPEHLVFRCDQLDLARAFLADHDGPFVVKPAVGSSAGIGVTTHIRNYDECLKAIALASLYDNQVILERFIPGEVYRLLVLDGEVIAASRRDGIRHRGDGKKNCREFIMQGKEASPAEPTGSSRSLAPDDRDIAVTLAAQGLNLESVPEAGSQFLLRSSPEVGAGYKEVRTIYTTAVLDEICDDLKTKAGEACKAIGTQLAGVDMITMDPTRPLKDSGGKVGELNTTPGLHHHYDLIGSAPDDKPAVKVLAKALAAR